MDQTRERTLLAAIHRGDGPAIVTVLTGDGRDLLQSMPQLAGDGLLCALDQQLPAAAPLAAELVAIVRHRDWDGDAELADQLDPPSSDPGQVPLRPLPVDLEQLAAILEGDPRDSGGRIDLTTGEVWPQPAFDYGGITDMDDDDEDEDEDTTRWLRVDCEGSRASYHDMAEFITTIRDPDLADRLDRAKAPSVGSKSNSHTTPTHSTAGSDSAPNANAAEHGNGSPPTATAPNRNIAVNTRRPGSRDVFAAFEDVGGARD